MIGTSTGEVFEDSVDHLLQTPNQRVSETFNDLNTEKPVIKAPDSPSEGSLGPEIAGAKAAQYTAWLGSMLFNPATRAAGGAVGTALTIPFMHHMRNGIIDDVKEQVANGTPIDKVEFKKGSAADGFGLFSHLEDRFGKPLHFSQEDLDTKELRGPNGIIGILQKHLEQGGKIPQLDYESMPESTNVEDRRTEDPIGNLIRREDWGRGGLRVSDGEDTNPKGPIITFLDHELGKRALERGHGLDTISKLYGFKPDVSENMRRTMARSSEISDEVPRRGITENLPKLEDDWQEIVPYMGGVKDTFKMSPRELRDYETMKKITRPK